MEDLSLDDKISHCFFEFMKTYEVVITKIHHPSNIVVRPAIITQADLDTLEVAGKLMINEEIIKDAVVVYYSETSGKYIRGKIRKLVKMGGEIKSAIYSIDYGFYDISVPFSKIHHPGGNKTIPPLATSCQLGNCFPIGKALWSVSETEAMKTIIGDLNVTVFVRHILTNSIMVDLYTKTSNINVGRWMVLNHLAVENVQGLVEDLQELCKPKEYMALEPADGEVINVRVQCVVSVEEFYVAKPEHYEQYLKDREEFTRYCEDQRELLPNEILCGRAAGYKCPYDGEYYERVHVAKIKNSGFKAIIQLLDWGEKIEVFHFELKKVDRDMILETPAIAMYCATEKKKDWIHAIQHYIHPGMECVITIKESGDDFYIAHEVIIH